MVCPTCGSKAVPIEYGEPGQEMIEASGRGEIILGGCCVGIDESPEWGCLVCESEWR